MQPPNLAPNDKTHAQAQWQQLRKIFGENQVYFPSAIKQHHWVNQDLLQEIAYLPAIKATTDMLQIMEALRHFKEMNFFVIVDQSNQPLGLLREYHLKDYVYSKYGLAILSNPERKKRVEDFISECPTAEISRATESMLEEFAMQTTSEGIVIMDNGRYAGFLFTQSLIKMVHQRQLTLIAEHNKTLQKKHQELSSKHHHIEHLSSQLAKYLSPQVYQSMVLGKTEAKREAYRQRVTVFFSDLQGFTALTDMLEAEVLTEILNQYFNEMSRIALKYEGTIDKFMGDGIMIFFGAPESKGVKEDALNCVLMALEMRKAWYALRESWLAQGIARRLKLRMGISTGYCTVGNFGSDDRLDYTIIGSTVNLASRLESLAPPDQILVSYSTYVLVREHIECTHREEIMVKGLAHPVKTYEVVNVLPQQAKKEERVSIENTGFSLHANLTAISSDEKKQLIHKLEQLEQQLYSAKANYTREN